MRFELPPLPYDLNALEPHISARTVEIHYTKHHQGYLSKLEAAIGGTPLAGRSLEEIVRSSDGSVYNLAAQVWNHSFYWDSMSPGEPGEPSSQLRQAIDRDLGGIDAFKTMFTEAANREFGSGWAWLVADSDGVLAVTSTSDAQNPMRDDLIPLLTLDVWEHAYYLDYQNERARYSEAFAENLINWDHASGHYASIESSAGRKRAAAASR